MTEGRSALRSLESRGRKRRTESIGGQLISTTKRSDTNFLGLTKTHGLGPSRASRTVSARGKGDRSSESRRQLKALISVLRSNLGRYQKASRESEEILEAPPKGRAASWPVNWPR
ncbi:hypothetical protein RP20_CCG018391 [Aedes albopictus]|nr:hypothetical protein RP20_CCG018391 [Aedes albopictus]